LALPTAPSGPRPVDYIVAIVDQEPITNAEVRSRAVRAEQEMARQGVPMPPRQEILRQVLDRLLDERSQLSFARDTGLRVEDAQVERTINGIAQQNNLTMAQMRARLEQDGVSFRQFQTDVRNEILLSRLRERDVEPRIRITDADIDAFVAEQQSIQGTDQLELNLAQILVRVPENASPEQVAALRARATDLAQRARSGGDFAALAREFSESPERAQGGELGLRPATRLPDLFVNAVVNLRPGQVSEVVRSGAGFHVLRVIERRQGGLASAVVQQTRARHILLRTSPQFTETQAVERLREIRARIEGGADFAALARELSQDPGSGANGGDLGWANPGQFVPEFEQAMMTLRPGQVSAPVVSRFGVHLIQVQERRTSELGVQEQRQIVRNILRERRYQAAYDDWAREIRARAYVELRDPPR
jgi:peptidyl-prolyl cis-trans isomerase SurA